ncbi:MAG: hypothetical protein JSU94_19290 [Phycisphaerales bacterium]|nr:MAG: hypothetical protein JSU94_19290 [Phycisphaerales bacterium]
MGDNAKEKTHVSAIPGLAMIGCLVTGVFALVNSYRTGSDLSLIAAALAVGIVACISFAK